MRRGGLVSKSVVQFSLPYNKNLVQRAKDLRKAGSLPEALLWREIKARQINGLDFDRQKIIGNYIVDFFCASVAIVIEIDDKSHDMKEMYDVKRDEFLLGLGLNVIHIPAKDVLKNPSAVAEWLRCYLLVE
ncbi:MAG: endonuclease domain-containing protein [Alphaproteobacteria bacterium]|nr:endonuclease domain-containing protein [Alphaproteobacteria bacterium]